MAADLPFHVFPLNFLLLRMEVTHGSSIMHRNSVNQMAQSLLLGLVRKSDLLLIMFFVGGH